MKRFFFVVLSAFIFCGCVSFVDGERAQSGALAVLARSDVKRLVTTGETSVAFSNPDKIIKAAVGRVVFIDLELRERDGEWELNMISEPDVAVLKSSDVVLPEEGGLEIKYYQRFYIEFTGSGECQLDFVTRKTKKKEIVRVMCD